MKYRAIILFIVSCYVLAFGDTVIFVQHTSTRVITFEDAMDMAKCVLRNHPSSGLIQ